MYERHGEGKNYNNGQQVAATQEARAGPPRSRTADYAQEDEGDSARVLSSHAPAAQAPVSPRQAPARLLSTMASHCARVPTQLCPCPPSLPSPRPRLCALATGAQGRVVDGRARTCAGTLSPAAGPAAEAEYRCGHCRSDAIQTIVPHNAASACPRRHVPVFSSLVFALLSCSPRPTAASFASPHQNNRMAATTLSSRHSPVHPRTPRPEQSLVSIASCPMG